MPNPAPNPDPSAPAAPVLVAALYKFVTINDCANLQAQLQQACTRWSILGTLLIAPEGINGTIAGSRASIDAFLALLRADARFADIEHKESQASQLPFQRMKVRIKREIVTLGRPEANPNRQVGTYVAPKDWNALIQDPDVLVLDTRNDYEYAVGSFAGAIDPGTQSFREFPAFVDKKLGHARDRKIAMFCTGGIRCEKATAFMLEQGFETVYHLKGGILKYLEEIPAEQSLWRGECFVFDERVTVRQGLHPGQSVLCPACGWAVSGDALESPQYRAGEYCPHCHPQHARNQL